MRAAFELLRAFDRCSLRDLHPLTSSALPEHTLKVSEESEFRPDVCYTLGEVVNIQASAVSTLIQLLGNSVSDLQVHVRRGVEGVV